MPKSPLGDAVWTSRINGRCSSATSRMAAWPSTQPRREPAPHRVRRIGCLPAVSKAHAEPPSCTRSCRSKIDRSAAIPLPQGRAAPHRHASAATCRSTNPERLGQDLRCSGSCLSARWPAPRSGSQSGRSSSNAYCISARASSNVVVRSTGYERTASADLRPSRFSCGSTGVIPKSES